MKINIFSPGRFHVCDLARELSNQGFDVKFYSFVSASRAEKFGLPRKCSASVLWAVWPFLLLERKLFKTSAWAKHLRIRFQDWVTSVVMRKADVVIAMSGGFVQAPRKAKKAGSIIIYERGSKHILEQKRILEAINRIKGVERQFDEFNVRRELASYAQADYIAIATKHVYESFRPHDFPMDKLFVNPYGVDLKEFYPMPDVEKKYDVIMVGGWSLRKGCDLIVDAIRQSGLKFLHVGGIVDLAFPKDENFTHVGAVDQKTLVNYYAQARVFVLPSREEGLAMVQAQAIACNLPMIGSPDSGAEDLQKMVANPEYIEIIKEFTPQEVLRCINIQLEKQKTMGDIRYVGAAADNLTWQAYGKRYAEFLNHLK